MLGAAAALRDDHGFNFLSDITAVDYLGWFGYFQILTFFLILLVGYVYVWRKGVLDWGHRRF